MIFHRKANRKTQTLRHAILQQKSRELWGRGAFGGCEAALAWHGPLPLREEGSEFTTEVPYAINGDPSWAYWYLPRHGGDPGVREILHKGENYACITINPTLSRYRCKK